MTTLNSTVRKLSDFLLSEAKGMRSRDNAVVTLSGAAIASGTLMRKLNGKWTPYTAGQTGTMGILYEGTSAGTGDVKAVIFARDCEVSRAALIGLDTNGEAQLGLAGIIVRGVYTN